MIRRRSGGAKRVEKGRETAVNLSEKAVNLSVFVEMGLKSPKRRRSRLRGRAAAFGVPQGRFSNRPRNDAARLLSSLRRTAALARLRV